MARSCDNHYTMPACCVMNSTNFLNSSSVPFDLSWLALQLHTKILVLVYPPLESIRSIDGEFGFFSCFTLTSLKKSGMSSIGHISGIVISDRSRSKSLPSCFALHFVRPNRNPTGSLNRRPCSLTEVRARCRSGLFFAHSIAVAICFFLVR